MRILPIFVCVAPLLSTMARAEPVSPERLQRIAELVKQLGDCDFMKREWASVELGMIGYDALPAVRAAAEDPDPEVRLRAIALVKAIKAHAVVGKTSGMVLALIDPGTFEMGSPDDERDRRPDEKRRTVKLDKHYLLGVFEVTQDQYRKVNGTEPSHFRAEGAGKEKVKGLATGTFPVESVTWFDAIEFCNKLSELDGLPPHYKMTDVKREGGSIRSAAVTKVGGKGYRLPTEAEWEFACRAGVETAFHFGTFVPDKCANVKPDHIAGGYGGGPRWAALPRTAAVGSYPANEWGLCDMHGNVAEWCWDWYTKDHPAGAAINPMGPEKGTHRVNRGGSWMTGEGACRSAARSWLIEEDTKNFVGIRVARDP